MKGKIATEDINDALIEYVTNYFQLTNSEVIDFCEGSLHSYSVKKPFIPESCKNPLKVFGTLKPDVAFYAIHQQKGAFGIVGESIGQNEYGQSSSSNSIAHESLKKIYEKRCNVYLAQKIMVQLFSVFVHFKTYLNIGTIYSFLAGEERFIKDIMLVLTELKEYGKHINQFYAAPNVPNGYEINDKIIIYKIEFPDDIQNVINEFSI